MDGERARRFEALTRLAQSVTRSPDLAETLRQVAAAATELVPDSYAGIWVAQDDRLLLRAEAGRRQPPLPGRRTTMTADEGFGGQVARWAKTRVVPDISTDATALNHEWMLAEGFVSYVGVPLIARERLVGVLTLLSRERWDFTGDMQEVLESFGAQAAIAIANADAYHRLRRLARLSRTVSASLDVETALREIVGAAAELMAVPAAGCWIADETSARLGLCAFSDPEAAVGLAADTVPFGRGLAGCTASARAPLHVPDVFADSRTVARTWYEARGLRSFLGLPVIYEGSLLAVLGLFGRRPFELDTPHQDLLDTFVAHAATAIRNAGRYQDSERRRRSAEALAQIDRALADSLDPDVVCARIVEEISQLLGVRAAALFRLDPQSGALALIARSSGEGTFPWLAVIPPGVGIGTLAVAQGCVVVTRDCLETGEIAFTPKFRRLLEDSDERAMLAAPLIAHGRTIGVLMVRDRTGREFEETARSLAQGLADRAAIALANASLFAAEKTARAALASERRVLELIATGAPLSEVLHAVCLGVEAQSEGALCAVMLVGRERDGLHPGGNGSVPEEFLEGTARLPIAPAAAACGTAAWRKAPVVTFDIAEDPLWAGRRARAMSFGLRACWSTPILAAGDEVLGTVAVYSRSPRHPTAAEAHVVDQATNLARIAIERDHAETALRESESRFQAFMDNSPAVVWVKDEHGRYVYVNQAYLKQGGWAFVDVVGKTVFDLWPESTARRISDDDEAVRRLGEVKTFMVELPRPDGTRGEWLAYRFPMRDAAGRRLLGGVSIDITERRRAERALKRETAFVELMQVAAVAANQSPSVEAALQTTVDVICLHTGWPVGHVLALDERNAEMVSAGVWHLEDPDRYEAFRAATAGARFVADDGLIGSVMRDRRPAWTGMLCHGIARPRHLAARDAGLTFAIACPVLVRNEVVAILEFFSVRAEEPDPPFLAVMEQIGTQLGRAIERARAGRALSESEARYRAIVQDQTESICRFRPDGTLTFVNDACCRYFGRARADLEGRSFMLLIPADERAAAEQQLTSLTPPSPVGTFERRALLPNGAVRWQHWTIRAIFDGLGRLVEYQSVGRDVTERRRAAEIRAQLLDRAIGAQEEERARIARELHDETGQSLASLLLGLSMIQRTSSLKAARAYARKLQRLAGRTLDEIRRLAHGLRPSALDDLGLIAVLERHVGEYASATAIKVDLLLEGFDDGRLPGAVETALYRIAQEALTNVLRHAAATSVTIALHRGATHVRMTVADDGRGFDPGLALGAAGHFGLHGIRERAVLLKGTARFDSTPGAGTRITVELPVQGHGED